MISEDGTKLVFVDWGREIETWCTLTGQKLDNPMSLPLDSYDIPGKHRFSLADLERSTPFTIRDAASDMVVFRSPARFARPTRVKLDGRYLVAVYETGEVLILDFVHMVPQ